MIGMTDQNPMAGLICWAVIPAAGIGKRMCADRPKQYLPVAGKTVIEHTLSTFLKHPRIQGITVAIGPDDPYWKQLEYSRDDRVHLVTGGVERADSVRNALRSLEGNLDGEDWVLVHDAARPCLRYTDLDRLLVELGGDSIGGILATPARDTLKQVGPEGEIQTTIDRSRLWHAQTPQMFHFKLLLDALDRGIACGQVITDESSVIEQAGFHPRIVEGHADNIKITCPEDLPYAEWLLSCRR